MNTAYKKVGNGNLAILLYTKLASYAVLVTSQLHSDSHRNGQLFIKESFIVKQAMSNRSKIKPE